MPWLIREGDVLAVVEDRRKGWHSSLQGALVLTGPALVHTFAGSPGLDLAWCRNATLEDGVAGFRVSRISAVAPRRAAPPRLGRGALVVAPVGTFERWRLQVGDCLEVRGG
jgi:hypothetical protein